MHHFCGVRRILGVIFAISLTLCSCSAGQRPEQRMQAVRERFETAEPLNVQCDITADYGERVYSYSVLAEGDVKNGKMTVIQPENIKGTVLLWSEGETSLEYDGMTLETGRLTQNGLSPADGFPILLDAIQSGTLLGWEESEEVCTVQLQSPSDSAVTVTCTFIKDSCDLQRAELAENGRRILTIDFIPDTSSK